MFALDAEKAHELGMAFLRSGLAGNYAKKLAHLDVLRTNVFGLDLANPIGIAAGFDKNALAVDQLADLGFGCVETGTLTFRPQPGNDKPRMFRLPDDKALINRLGFNNLGAAAAVERIKRSKRKCVIGVNIGKNKDVPNEEATQNYLASFDLVHGVADYIAVNISSPNTPNLRELQKADSLEELLSALSARNAKLGKKPLLVKIAPDLTESEIDAIADISRAVGISGIIATNTTISRDGLSSPQANETGGLSGVPVRNKANAVISRLWKSVGGEIPIVGVGGVFNADDAFEKISLGASLVQLYTGFIYGGPATAYNINVGLAAILKERGFENVASAVGSAY